MAITNVLRKGFDRVNNRNATCPNGKVNMCFIGDLMKITDEAVTASTGDLAMGLQLVAQAANGGTTNINAGVLASVNQHLGVSIANTVLARRHRPASVGMYVMVYDDPSEEYF